MNDFLNDGRLRSVWGEIADELEAHKPSTHKIRFWWEKWKMDRNSLLPKNALKKEGDIFTERISLSDNEVAALKDSHEKYAAKIPDLAKKLPYWPESRGVVMTTGGKYIGMALTTIFMFRRANSTLPIQLWLDNYEQYDSYLCEDVLPRYDAECLVITEILQGLKVSTFQYKILSMLFSPFQHVLFVDSDCFPVENPDNLFDIEPYASTGLVTWPDWWITTISSRFWDIVGRPPMARDWRSTTDSGALMYDKRRHTKSLLLALYYNWNGPGLYYPLLTQGAPGEGDKETFLLAADYFNETFYNVKEPPVFIGRFVDDKFKWQATVLGNPVDDMRLNSNLSMYEIAGLTNDTENRPKAKRIFIHHNNYKINVFKLDDGKAPMYEKVENNSVARLWQNHDLNEKLGYDVEKALWQTLAAEGGKMNNVQTDKLWDYIAEAWDEPKHSDINDPGRKAKEFWGHM